MCGSPWKPYGLGSLRLPGETAAAQRDMRRISEANNCPCSSCASCKVPPSPDSRKLSPTGGQINGQRVTRAAALKRCPRQSRHTRLTGQLAPSHMYILMLREHLGSRASLAHPLCALWPAYICGRTTECIPEMMESHWDNAGMQLLLEMTLPSALKELKDERWV